MAVMAVLTPRERSLTRASRAGWPGHRHDGAAKLTSEARVPRWPSRRLHCAVDLALSPGGARSLLALHRARQWQPVRLPVWPRVVAVVPARNEAETIADSIGSLLRQDYPGAWTVILVDDDSSDGTAAIAHGAAAAIAREDRLRVVTSRGLPAGWTGKLWALKQGIDAAAALPQPPDYLLLTDADIVHAPDPVGRMVAHAEPSGLVLTSLMAKLRCESLAERAASRPSSFFPDALSVRLGQPADSAVAAAAGGCMLVRADALSGGRHRGHPRRADRRLRAGEGAQGAGTDLARPDRARAQHPALPGIRRHPAHGGALGLCAAALFAAAAGGDGGRHGAHLSGAAAARDVRLRPRADRIGYHLGADGDRVPADAAVLRRVAVLGFGAAADCAAYMLFTLDSAYQYVRGRGGSWKGACRPTCRTP